MKNSPVIYVLALFILSFALFASADSLVYGPEAFARTEGAPNVYSESFNAVPGDAYVVLFNGDDEQDSRVSSGSVTLNGAEVISESDLNQQVDRVIKPVVLAASNTMQVTLNGAPDGYVTILVVRDRKDLPEVTAGRIHLAWVSVADPAVSVSLRLKNGSPCFKRGFQVRYFNEDGTLAAVSERQQMAPHASMNTPVQSYLPAGAVWQTGSVEILFAGEGGGRILGYGVQSDASSQEEITVPLQFGGLRHFFYAPKSK